VRVRGAQVHGQTAEAAVAGQRTALNLAGTSAEDLSRGMILAPPATFEAIRRADVRLRLLSSAPRPLKDRARVHFHSYTMETVAEVVLQGTKQIAQGEEAFARLKLPEATLLLPGDRFIIRQFSPVVTIGGGVVLDAAPIPRMPGHADFLKTLASGDAEAILRARIARRHREGISMSRLVAETGWAKNVIETQMAQALRTGHVVRAGELFLDSPALEALKSHIMGMAADFHKNNPLVGGISKEELRAQVDASPEVFETAAVMLVREKKLELVGDLVRLPGHGVAMRDEEVESKKKIEDAFASAGLKVPALQEVIASLKVDKARAHKIVTLLLRDKVLVKVSDELVFHRGALEELRRQMTAYKMNSAKIDVAKFKELTGVTRKYAIPLLEYLDRERVTRRVGDVREIL
jgi:selenocysteine-specific elongation factor